MFYETLGTFGGNLITFGANVILDFRISRILFTPCAAQGSPTF